MKVAYVVRTSEDGNIGVYTNKKRVYEAVDYYFNSSWESEAPTDYDGKVLNYGNLRRALKENYGIMYSAGSIEVEIQIFKINK